MLTDDEVRDLVERMLKSSGRRVDLSSPFVDAVLPDGSRLHVVIPDITREHWFVNIRKFVVKADSMDDLVRLGTLTRQAARFLEAAVASGLNILVAGGTQAGKTTMLNCLASAIPARERVVTCEEVFELRIPHRDVAAMQCRQPSLEGTGEVPLRRLVKEALRMRPSRIIVGEVRQAESLDLLIALNSGLPGYVKAQWGHDHTRRAAIYARISQDRTGAGLGVQRQREDCEALAERLGWRVVASTPGQRRLAYSGKPRPGYLALLERSARARSTAVLAWHEDRLHRSPRELEDYIDACDPRGSPDALCAGGRAGPSDRLGAHDGTNPRRRVTRRVRAQERAYEAGPTSGRRGGQVARRCAARSGGTSRTTAAPPLNRREAREVREAAKTILAGASLGSVVADLNARGVTTVDRAAVDVHEPSTGAHPAAERGPVGAQWGGDGRSSLAPDPDRGHVARGVRAARRSDPQALDEQPRPVAARRYRGLREGRMRAAAAVGHGRKNRAKGTNRTVYRCPAGGGARRPIRGRPRPATSRGSCSGPARSR